jgi:hypothetical protein
MVLDVALQVVVGAKQMLALRLVVAEAHALAQEQDQDQDQGEEQGDRQTRLSALLGALPSTLGARCANDSLAVALLPFEHPRAQG